MREELKHKIIIRGEEDPGYTKDTVVSTHCYYILDLNSCEVSSVIPHTESPNSVIGSTFVIGSKLFIFGDPFVGDDGDEYDDKTRSYSYELTQPQQGWRRSPSPLISFEWILKGVEFGGKIYVFRGSDDRCRCEVFDPELNQWSFIRSLPGHKRRRIYIEGPVLADHKGNRIIVWFQNIRALYGYYPNEDRWECVAQEFRGWAVGDNQITLADGVIYVFDGFGMTAFHLATKQWFQVCLPPEFKRSGLQYKGLLHRGNGLLCLLGYLYSPRELPVTIMTTCDMVVHAVEFKVCNINEADKKLHLTWLSSKKFVLPEPCNIYNCLLV